MHNWLRTTKYILMDKLKMHTPGLLATLDLTPGLSATPLHKWRGGKDARGAGVCVW